MSSIRTVRGDIPAEAFGVAYLHEHLHGYSVNTESDLDLRLDSEAAAATELAYFKLAGGQALVEMSPKDYSRDPLMLRRLSEAAGVHIVAVSGYIKGTSADPFVQDQEVNAIADEMIREVAEGIDGTNIRAGLLKAGSSLNKITPNEEKIFRAAGRAHRETGAAISTHTEAGTMALEQVALLKAEGVPAEKILIGHTDRRLDWDYHRAIANTGVTLGYDQFSKEKYYPDFQRVEFIARMVREGFGAQLAVSGDLARRSDLVSYGGGPGYTFILWRVLPWLRKEGLSESDIQTIMIHTPRRLLALET